MTPTNLNKKEEASRAVHGHAPSDESHRNGAAVDMAELPCETPPRPSSEEDPLLRWAGFIDDGPADAAQNHDQYLGSALLSGMRPDTQ